VRGGLFCQVLAYLDCPVLLNARGVGGLELAEAGAEELGLRGRGGVGIDLVEGGFLLFVDRAGSKLCTAP
jgi:hypothetical protein